jgi:adenosylcobinamide-GDP ribazoletransferase
MINRELQIFLTAIIFYTRIPVPKNTGFSEENLNRATRYLPLVGMLIGGSGALVFVVMNMLLGVQISVLISIVVMVLLTGAFHEDGLADFCDGFGGGYSKDQILKIMKDSRIGTYGAIALVLLFVSKILLLSEIWKDHIPSVLISAHALSRLNPVLLIFTSRYVGSAPQSKSKPVGKKISVGVLLIAAFFGLAPLFFLYLAEIPVLVMIPSLVGFQILILLIFRFYIHRKIGGYTGDVLGALQQISEIGYYLTFLTIIHFI